MYESPFTCRDVFSCHRLMSFVAHIINQTGRKLFSTKNRQKTKQLFNEGKCWKC